jgi:purine-binding chemotaxis protein CheW
MPDPVPSLEPSAKAFRRFLTFWSQHALYALPADEILEVIRVPDLARVPQGPAGLLGLANVRGSVLPMASLRGLLGQNAAGISASSRGIVLNGATSVALVVDAVDTLLDVDPQHWEGGQAELAIDGHERLRGAFRVERGDRIAKVIDTEKLLASAFVPRPRGDRRSPAVQALQPTRGPDPAAHERQRIVTFEVAGQEYGLEVGAVQEILPAPALSTKIPRSDSSVFGLTAYRNQLLPLLSLRGLLGLPPAETQDGCEKVLVTMVRSVLVGLVADGARDILSVDPRSVEPLPAMLAMRSGGESRIKAVYRGESGKRLVSILDVETLFREDIMQRLGPAGESAPERERHANHDDSLHFLIFRLDGNDFGLAVEAIEEVTRVPPQITRVPKAPKFLEGVINHRGAVLPVVDQRSRFDMPKSAGGTARRLVVVRSARHRAGLIVDSVSEVLRTERANVEAAPDLTGQSARLVNGVINLPGRMVLTLEPEELLSRAERGLLDTFEAKLKTKAR